MMVVTLEYPPLRKYRLGTKGGHKIANKLNAMVVMLQDPVWESWLSHPVFQNYSTSATHMMVKMVMSEEKGGYGKSLNDAALLIGFVSLFDYTAFRNRCKSGLTLQGPTDGLALPFFERIDILRGG